MINIDIPKDPELAFEHGWEGALTTLQRRYEIERDKLLTPINKEDQNKLQELTLALDIISGHKDIQTVLARPENSGASE